MFKVMFIVTITYSIFMHVSPNIQILTELDGKGSFLQGSGGGGVVSFAAASTRTTFLSLCFECVVSARDNEGLSREAARHFLWMY